MKNIRAKKSSGGRMAEEKREIPLFVRYGLIAAAIMLVITVGLVIYFNSAPTIVATVGGEKITEGEFLYFLDYQKQFMYYSAQLEDASLTEETFWATKIGGEEPKEKTKRMTIEELKNIK